MDATLDRSPNRIYDFVIFRTVYKMEKIVF